MHSACLLVMAAASRSLLNSAIAASTRADAVLQVTDDPYGAVAPPLYQTATFHQLSAVDCGEYDYSRSGNPTRSQLEAQMAALEARHSAMALCCAALQGCSAPCAPELCGFCLSRVLCHNCIQSSWGSIRCTLFLEVCTACESATLPVSLPRHCCQHSVSVRCAGRRPCPSVLQRHGGPECGPASGGLWRARSGWR